MNFSPHQSMHFRAFFLFIIFAFQTQLSFGKITVPSLVGDNMVLQQKSEVAIWGKANARTTVVITPSWNNKKYMVTSSIDGDWLIKVLTPAAGRPFSITLSDGEELALNNVLVGEVWICSGQSNMSMPMMGYQNQPIKDSNAELLQANNPNIRLFSVSTTASRTPQEDCTGKWEVSSPRSARVFSAIGFEFGTILEQSLHVPVGIIHSSWGGSPIEAWISDEVLNTIPYTRTISPNDTNQVASNDPAALYNGMINPLLLYGIRGFLWYQGESNAYDHSRYNKLMIELITDWRTRWGQGNLPFYYVQIAPYEYPNSQINSAYLREAQLRVMQQMSEVGMAVALDVGEEKYIHPSNKSDVSKRLVYWALAKTCGWDGIAYSGPLYDSMQIVGSKVQLTFSGAPNGLSTFGKELKDFEVAGDDRIFHPAQAEINSIGVVVSSSLVQNPVAVRYAFKNWVVGSLYNVEGLPASSFQTDEWK